MAVIHGSMADIFLNGYNAGNWFNTVTSSASKELNDATILNNAGYKMYHARMKEAQFSMSGFFDALADDELVNVATLDAHTGDYALHSMIQGGVVGGADDILLHFPAGATSVGDIGYGAKGAATTYGLEGGSGDLMGASVELTSCVGRERSVLAHPLASRTMAAAAFTGTTIDNGAATTDGGSAYLMVTDWVSGSLPAIIEHSTDGVAWSTLASFAAVGADHAFERIELPGTINRYTRAATATGTFQATFLVAIHRN